jgi:hypothetical protein
MVASSPITGAMITIGSKSPGHRRPGSDDAVNRRVSLGSGNSSRSKRPLTSSSGSDQVGTAKSKKGRVLQPKTVSRTRTSSQANLTLQIRSRKRSRVAGDAPGRVHVQTSIMAFCVRSQDVVGNGSSSVGPAGSPVLPPDR